MVMVCCYRLDPLIIWLVLSQKRSLQQRQQQHQQQRTTLRNEVKSNVEENQLLTAQGRQTVESTIG